MVQPIHYFNFCELLHSLGVIDRKWLQHTHAECQLGSTLVLGETEFSEAESRNKMPSQCYHGLLVSHVLV